jgi:hypothetical protein
MKRFFLIISFFLISGCATYQPIPKEYNGPVASVADSGFNEDGTTAQLFVLNEIEGNQIDTSFGASAEASYGQGFALTTVITERKVPARPMRVKLYGGHTTAAPIQALYKQMAGTFYTVEGEVDFSPKANGKYVVKGELSENSSSIWIEDAKSGEKVTEVVREID